MNRKNKEMAKRTLQIVAGLHIIALLLLIFAGCAAGEVSAAEPGDGNRFTAVKERAPGEGFAIYTYVITDNETGVQYLYIDNGYDGGLTVLQPGDTTAEE